MLLRRLDIANPVPREADSSDCRALFYFQEISPSVFQQLTPRLPVMNDMIIHHNGPVKCFEKREECCFSTLGTPCCFETEVCVDVTVQQCFKRHCHLFAHVAIRPHSHRPECDKSNETLIARRTDHSRRRPPHGGRRPRLSRLRAGRAVRVPRLRERLRGLPPATRRRAPPRRGHDSRRTHGSAMPASRHRPCPEPSTGS